MNDLKQLIISEAKRVIEVLETGNFEGDGWNHLPDRAELKAKMAELRRDTIRLDKKL